MLFVILLDQYIFIIKVIFNRDLYEGYSILDINNLIFYHTRSSKLGQIGVIKTCLKCLLNYCNSGLLADLSRCLCGVTYPVSNKYVTNC